MEFATAVSIGIGVLLLAFGWKRHLFHRYSLFYTYIIITLAFFPIVLLTVRVYGVDSQQYLYLYTAGLLLHHSLEIALLIKAYFLFSERPSMVGFYLALLVIACFEAIFAPFPDLPTFIRDVLLLFEAYCCARAAVAIFSHPNDAGANWKAIVWGLLVSSVVLAVNQAGSITSPRLWPYQYFYGVIQLSQVAMWSIFLMGMRRYSPPAFGGLQTRGGES